MMDPTSPMVVAIGPNLDFTINEEKTENSIKLENQKLTRANKKIEKNFNSILEDFPSCSNSHEAVITRLASLYEDPNYGPGYFHGTAQVLKSLLIVYKGIKTDPTREMFFLKKFKTGIHIHFNTVTKKKEVIIPVGFHGIDPVRIDIKKLGSWYKKKRIAAIKARSKVQKEMQDLRLKVLEVDVDRAHANVEYCNANVEYCNAQLGMWNGIMASKNDNSEVTEKLNKLIDRLKREVTKQKEELLSHNQVIDKLKAEKGMYEEKFFLEKMLEVFKTAIKKYNNIRDIFSSFTDQIKLLQ